jgi:hypothetical protein
VFIVMLMWASSRYAAVRKGSGEKVSVAFRDTGHVCTLNNSPPVFEGVGTTKNS